MGVEVLLKQKTEGVKKVMWMSEKLWRETVKILRTEDFTKKMKQIAEDYADLVIKHIEYAKENSSADQGKIIALEIVELRKLYTEFILMMKPFDTGMSQKEKAMYMSINLISTLVSLVALAIVLL